MKSVRCLAMLWCLLICVAPTGPAAAFGLEDLRRMLGRPAGVADGLSQEEAARGLREALQRGAEVAVRQLGAEGGFLADSAFRIPPPAPLDSVEPGLRRIGLNQLADDFSTSMNRAAEQAVSVALPVLTDAVKNLTAGDALAIVAGSRRAATDYLRRHSGERIRERMLPLVVDATNRTGVTRHYKQLADRAGPLLSSQIPDLDGYVTDRAVDGLFEAIAAEEKRIRDNPAARTSELLRRVFAQ